MCCVASAPIVPLARKLDAGLGMPRGELPFISAHSPLLLKPHPLFYTRFPTPLLTPPLPFKSHPHFFVGCPATFSSPFSISSRPRIFSTRCTRRSYSLRTCLRAFPHLRHVPPGCTPFPPRGHRCNGAFLPKTQKNEHRSLGSGARFGLLSGRHSAEWC